MATLATNEKRCGPSSIAHNGKEEILLHFVALPDIGLLKLDFLLPKNEISFEHFRVFS